MLASQLSLLLAGTLVTTHVLLVYRLYRLRTDTDDRSEATTDRVVCAECQTANEAAYRYCQACVSELPGSTGFEWGHSGPLDGLTR